jgi:hypothetical protein
MSIPQAIKGYNSLASVLATTPTETKNEREINMAKFREVFEKLLVETSHTVDTPMRVHAGRNGKCKVLVLPFFL